MNTHLLFGALSLSLASTAAEARTTYIPIQYRQDAGTRPFIPARLGGKTLLMMVHSGASFYMMTTHKNARAAGIDQLKSSDTYGITSVGHVSSLGRARTTLPSLIVGNVEVKNVPLLVFEIPQVVSTDGMLGVGWLTANHVILDFDAGRVGLPATARDSAAADEALVARGYVAHKMSNDPKAGYYVQGTINGVSARISVNTVMGNVLDSEFAKRSGIVLGPVVDDAGGPKGAVLPVHIAKYQLTVAIDGQATAPTQPLSWDMAAYHSAPPGSVKDNLALGVEFMLANQAVIDFGSETLFIPKNAGSGS
jgi:hypothetical protein